MRTGSEWLAKTQHPFDWISILSNHLFAKITEEIILRANDLSTGLCILKGVSAGQRKSCIKCGEGNMQGPIKLQIFASLVKLASKSDRLGSIIRVEWPGLP